MAIENTYLLGSGITVAGGFDLQAKAPLDSRQTVPVYAGLAALIAGNACYEGMIVYCEEDKKTYQYKCTSISGEGDEVVRNCEFVEFGFSTDNIENSLTSDSTTKALSAAQGKILKGMIDKIDTSLGGLTSAMRFMGKSTTDPNSLSGPTIEGKPDYVPANGDVIIYETAEFVYANDVWVELGDVSDEANRLTTLENIINDTIAGKDENGEDIVIPGLKSQVESAVSDASIAKAEAADAKGNAATALGTANEAKEAAITAQNSAAASAAAASNSALAAADSAAAALASEQAAEGAKGDAENAASAAAGHAEAAAGSAQTASGKADEAAQSATDANNAKTAAETAQGKAEEAQSAAEEAQSAAETAKTYAEAAEAAAEQAMRDANSYANQALDAQEDAEQAKADAEAAQAAAESARDAALDSNNSATAIANAAKAASETATQAVSSLHTVATSGSAYDLNEVGTAKNSAGETVPCLIFWCGTASDLV